MLARGHVLLSLSLSFATAITPVGTSRANRDDGTPESRVTGGSEAVPCAYPSVLLLNTELGSPSNPQKASCTGTLVHPRVILYAAHCGRVTAAMFTETRTTPKRRTLTEADIAKQQVNPRYKNAKSQAIDWAYVVLKEPITDVPTIPIAAGCERAMLQKRGAEVYFSGFSPNESKEPSATMLRWAQTSIRSLGRDKVDVGGRRVTACGGDSGGPLLAKAPDGSWRSLGIASTLTGGCGTARGFNTYALVGRSMTAWVERESGIDITPCYDDAGQPTPSLACDKLMAYAGDPKDPQGTREKTCAEAKRLPAKDACNVPDSGESDPEDEGAESNEPEDSENSESPEDSESPDGSETPEESEESEASEEEQESEESEESESPETNDTEASKGSPEAKSPKSPAASPEKGQSPEASESGESGDSAKSPKGSKNQTDDDSASGETEGCSVRLGGTNGTIFWSGLLLLIGLHRRKSGLV